MKHKITLGVILTLIAAFLYSSQTAIVKAQASFLPPLPVVIFIQSVVCFLLVLPFVFRKGLLQARQTIRSHNIKLQLLRTIFSLGLSFLLFYSVKFISLVNSMLLVNTAPLMVPFLAYAFMGQKMNHQIWFPIILGFIGVTVVLHPDTQIFNWGSILALCAAVLMASTVLAVKKLAAKDSTETTAFYFFLFSTMISGVISIPFWQPITLTMWVVMFTVGAMYFLVQYANTHALQYINAQLVSTLFYSNIIFAAMFSWWLWDSLPTAMTWIGIALIVSGGILCVRVERQTYRLTLLQDELRYATAEG